jgi:hypothetical protein
MPFIDTSLDTGRLESMGTDGLESIRQATHVGKGEKRRRLVAVAILADMEKKGRTLAVVTRPYAYTHPIHEQDVTIEIPLGFVTDFASIPPFFQSLIQPFGRHAPAAVLHDYLYAIGQKRARAIADRLFLNAMREAGVPAFRRSLMYRMVRLFGGGGYGLKDDWKFVDAETGEDAEPPYSTEGISWAPPKPKRGKKAAPEA